MGIQIDQSGKIEDTAKDTVLAYSNDTQRAVLIPKKVKRQILEYFRLHGETRVFIYNLFAVGIYFLISHLKLPTTVVIDIEYPGKDKAIEKLITQFLKENNKADHLIFFSQIGRHPKVHYAAKDVFDKKIKPDSVLKYEEIVDKIKSRWAFKRMSFNPGRRSTPAVRHIITKKHKKSR